MEVDEDRIEGENSGTAVLGRHSNCNPLKLITRTSIAGLLFCRKILIKCMRTRTQREKWGRSTGRATY